MFELPTIMASWHCRSRSSKVPWLMFRWVGRACAAGIFGSAARTPGFGKGRSGGSQPMEWTSCYWPYIVNHDNHDPSILIYWYIIQYTQYIHVYPVSGYLHQHVSTKTWHGIALIQEVKSQGQATSAGLSWAQLSLASRGPSDRIPVGSRLDPQL